MSVGPSTGAQVVSHLHPWETVSFLQQSLLGISISSRGGISWGLSPIQNGIFAGLLFCGSYAYSHSHCEFMCATALPYPGITVWLQTSTNSGSYDLSTPILPAVMPEPWAKRLCVLQTSCLELNTNSLLLSAHWLVLGLCHLLQSSPAESTILIWVWWENLSSNLILCPFSRIIVLHSPLSLRPSQSHLVWLTDMSSAL